MNGSCIIAWQPCGAAAVVGRLQLLLCHQGAHPQHLPAKHQARKHPQEASPDSFTNLICCSCAVLQERLKGVHAVWQQRRHVNASTLEQLRAQAWAMFDHGFSNYMKHAFPQVRRRGAAAAGVIIAAEVNAQLNQQARHHGSITSSSAARQL